jgi:hypothetical protein
MAEAGWIRALAGAAALALSPAALAQETGKPMTFAWGTVYGDTPAIFADGEFTADTPLALRTFLRRTPPAPDTRVYFNSLGGDLRAAMEVGRLVRQVQLNTGVARNTRTEPADGSIDLNANSRIYPGYCISACALAFLGGVSRRVEAGGTYAVHQVSLDCVDKREARGRYPWVLIPGRSYCPELDEALSMVQQASGAVVEYVRSMGADPIFLTEMSKAGPATINALTEQQLEDYRINYTLRSVSWSYETDSEGRFFLRHVQADQWKSDQVEFYCDRAQPATPRLLMWTLHDTRRPSGRAGADELVALAGRGLTARWQSPPGQPGGLSEIRNEKLAAEELVRAAAVTESGNVSFTLDLSKRFVDVMTTAEKFQVVTSEAPPGTVDGINLITMELDRDRIAGIARSCR